MSAPGCDQMGAWPARRTVVVVGASLAGLRAAETLRAEGFTRPPVLVGDELHLPYDRPPLSKQVLAGTWPPERAMLADQARLDELRVELRARAPGGRLDAEARRVELDDGDGARGRRRGGGHRGPPPPSRAPRAGRDVHVLRTLDDSPAPRRPGRRRAAVRVVVIGRRVHRLRGGGHRPGLGARGDRARGPGRPRWPRPLGARVGAACGDAAPTPRGDAAGRGRGRRRRPRPADGPAGRVELADGRIAGGRRGRGGHRGRPSIDWLAGSGLDVSARGGV